MSTKRNQTNKRNLTRAEIHLREQRNLAIWTVCIGLVIIALMCLFGFLNQDKVEEPIVTITPTPVVTAELTPEISKEPEVSTIPETISVTGENRDRIATMFAKTIFGESRGIASITEQACIVWTVLNRVDAGYGNIEEVLTAPDQFYYREHFPTVDDYGRDLKELANDVIIRWEREHAGETDIGRVLAPEYIFYSSNNWHNWFRRYWKHDGVYWDYSLESPYES